MQVTHISYENVIIQVGIIDYSISVADYHPFNTITIKHNQHLVYKNAFQKPGSLIEHLVYKNAFQLQ